MLTSVVSLHYIHSANTCDTTLHNTSQNKNERTIMRAAYHHHQQNLGSVSSSFKKNTQQIKRNKNFDGKKTIIRSAAKNDDVNENASEKDENNVKRRGKGVGDTLGGMETMMVPRGNMI